MRLNSLLRCSSLAILNLQPTFLDPDAKVVLHADIDTAFHAIMKAIKIEVPSFRLKRWVHVRQRMTRQGDIEVRVGGVTDADSQAAGTIVLFKEAELVSTQTGGNDTGQVAVGADTYLKL